MEGFKHKNILITSVAAGLSVADTLMELLIQHSMEAHLLSEECSYVNDQVIVKDGGESNVYGRV